MQKLLTIFAVILLVTFNASAQNMLGASYDEVRTNYKEKRDILTNWEEGTNKNGVFNVSYSHKDNGYFMICFFENGEVFRYVICDTEDQANRYAKRFNEDFVQVNTNTWIDYSADCTWELLLEDGMMYLEAHLIEKD